MEPSDEKKLSDSSVTTSSGDGGIDGGALVKTPTDAGSTPEPDAAPPPPPLCEAGKKVQLTRSPGSVVTAEALQSVGGGSISTQGLEWTNAAASKTSDDTSASVLLTYPIKGSRKLVLTNFGFDVPAGAKIDGIRYDVERRASVISAVSDLDVRVLVGGAALLSSNLASNAPWGNFDALASYGGPTATFGYGWKAEDVNDIGFGVAFAAWTIVTSDAPAPTAYVDSVKATVFFTCP